MITTVKLCDRCHAMITNPETDIMDDHVEVTVRDIVRDPFAPASETKGLAYDLCTNCAGVLVQFIAGRAIPKPAKPY